MRLDRGNRSFVLLLAAGLSLYLVASAAACVLASLLVYRLASDGTDGFGEVPWVIIPAIAFLALLGAGGILGVRSLGEQIASSRRLRRRIDRLGADPTAGLAAVAQSAGLQRKVVLLEGHEPFSFTYGAFRPRVVVSRALLERTSGDELQAVLAHERYHVRNLDPLKVVLARALARGFFFLPALRELEARYFAERELAADRRALHACGRRSLAGALAKAVRGPGWHELNTAAAIGGPELLGARVAQLESGAEPPPAAVPRGALALSAAGGLVLVLSFAAALVGLGGLEAALELSADDPSPGWTGAAMVIGCALPWAVAGWLAWRWLSA
jgi:Zn-dependent protease with chaperone function